MKQLKILSQITKRTPTLEKYFLEIDKVPLITADEEVKLTQRIRKGDQVALEKLTKANLRFVVSVAKQYDRGIHNLTLGDLISEGNVGLIKAASKFDETRGFKFISYAVWWIRQAIIAAISENSRVVRQPINRVSSYNRVTRSFAELEQKYEREPTDDEVAEALDLTEDYVIQIKRVGSHAASLDAPLMTEEVTNLINVLEDPEAVNPEATSLLDSCKADINNVLDMLTTRESEVLIHFYGLNNTPVLTLNDIGMRFEISMERVRQIKESALFKLKQSVKVSALLRSHLN
ncbi:sigma-70 family RNA polymerase sigma factor [Ekhidna sp. To15]|uniref:sigma-70 family RNA polymerase sigma factor n=1 Tax=Ekhidna sp. To15 TaxID=3395267 RepID=UPI003F524897